MIACEIMIITKRSPWTSKDLRVRGSQLQAKLMRKFCAEKEELQNGGDKEMAGMPLAVIGCSHTFEEDVALVSLLKECITNKNLTTGSKIHAHMLQRGLLQKNIPMGSTLVSVYAKCGALGKAHLVFDEFLIHDVVSWTALIVGCAQHGHGQKAVDYFEMMKQEGLSPDPMVLACILKACGGIGAVEKGKELHAEIVRKNLLRNDVALGNAMVDMYAKCGALKNAQDVFEELCVRDLVSWNAMITGYVQHGCNKEAFDCFEDMKGEGLSPNEVTLMSVLQCCRSIQSAEKGEKIHAEIIRKGLLEKHDMLGNALVDMYANVHALGKARQLSGELPYRNKVSWTALIAGYCDHGYGKEALRCYKLMQQEGVSADALTFAWILKACGSIGAVKRGKEIHAEISKEGLLQQDAVLGNALVDMYVKCGAIVEAQQVFDDLPLRDVFTWTALITAYCQHGHCKKALNCFEQMQHNGPSPDAVTLLCVLQVCGSMGAADKGQQTHADIIREAWLGEDSGLGNALVDMYAKCGALGKAQQAFDELSGRDVVSWTALMAGYAQAGKHRDVFGLFHRMVEKGLQPNLVTFSVLLSSCIDVGVVHDGQAYFKSMSTMYGMSPTSELYACMVELFSRAGLFDKAVAVINGLSSLDYLPVWLTLLGACRKWGNAKVGRHAFEHVV